MIFKEFFCFEVKGSMLKKKYLWKVTPSDEANKKEKDSKVFNREEGYEVIQMIQKVVDYFGYPTGSDVKKVEDVMAEKLPGNVRSHEKVFNWLTEYLLQI